MKTTDDKCNTPYCRRPPAIKISHDENGKHTPGTSRWLCQVCWETYCDTGMFPRNPTPCGACEQ